MKPSSLARLLALVVLALVPLGCPVYIDLYEPNQSAGTMSSTGGAVGGAGGTGTSGTGGTGGTGGVCAPASIAPCYDGPPGTEGHGLCQAGAKTCNAEGTAYGPCVGEVTPNPEDCATATDEDCDGLAPACKGAFVWAKSFGDANSPQVANGVAVDGAGNVVLVGSFLGSIDFGGGPLVSAGSSDVFVAKFDASGGHLWSKRFGDVNPQSVSGVAVDGAGNIVLVGSFNGTVDLGGGPLVSAGTVDVFVAKLDGNGSHLWSKNFGDVGPQFAGAVVFDGAGNVLLDGHFSGSINFGGGPLVSTGGNDAFITKLDAGGAHVWSKRFGDGADQSATGVAVDQAGNVIFVGSFSGSVNLGGAALTGTNDTFIAKLDAGGAHVWSKSFGDENAQIPTGVAVDGAGSVVVVGYSDGSVDFGGGPLTSAGAADTFIAKLDASGMWLWSQSFGDVGDQIPNGVAVDGAGNIVLVGYFNGSVDFGGGPLASAGAADTFVAKLDVNGAHLWSKRFGDALDQLGVGAAMDSAGYALVAGFFFGTVNFGGGPLVSAGGSDVFLAKFAP